MPGTIDYGIYKGVILRSYSIDHPKNTRKLVVQYDIQIVSPRFEGLVIENCIALNSFGGAVNFNEAVLQQRSKVLIGNTLSYDMQPDYADNSFVVVAFLEGKVRQCFILGAWPHPSNQLEGATTADGIRLLGEFNGIQWNINKDGELIVRYNGGIRDPKTNNTERPSTAITELKIDKDGKFSIIDNENQLIRLDRTNKTIKITSNNNENILLDNPNKKIQIDINSNEIITLDDNAKTIKLSCGNDEYMQLDHTAHTIKVDCGGNAIIEMDKASKNVTVSTAGDAKVIIDGTSGKIQIQAGNIEVGDALLEYIVKATMLVTYLTAQEAIYNGHTHYCGVGPTTPPLTPMTPPTEAQIASLKHKVE